MMKKLDQIIIPSKPLTVDETLALCREYQRIKEELIKMNPDFTCKIKDKQYTKKSGWYWLGKHFGVSEVSVERERENGKNGEFVYRFISKVQDGFGHTSFGVGACSSKERSFAHVEHDVMATAHTRAKIRAISDLIGGGEVSADEIQSGGSQ